MLPDVLTRRAERGHRSLPVGVEAVPLLRALYSAETHVASGHAVI